jgi:hypothetical protein
MHKPKNQAPDILAAKALASLEINLGICKYFRFAGYASRTKDAWLQPSEICRKSRKTSREGAMGKTFGEQGYYYRNFDYACKVCQVSEESQARIKRCFLQGHILAESALLKHFSECSEFYSHIFINHYTYSRDNDAALVIYKRVNQLGMDFILDPILPNIMNFGEFAASVFRSKSETKEVEVKQQPTTRLELKDKIEIKDYGIKFDCGNRNYYIVSHAKVVQFEYSYKSSYAEVLASLDRDKDKDKDKKKKKPSGGSAVS